LHFVIVFFENKKSQHQKATPTHRTKSNAQKLNPKLSYIIQVISSLRTFLELIISFSIEKNVVITGIMQNSHTPTHLPTH
jgi:hypothetical protein